MKKIWSIWKTKWGIETDKEMLYIFFIFAIAGSSTLFVRKFLFNILGLDNISPQWLFIAIKFIGIYIVYQFVLLAIGTILGRHSFFKWFLLKMNKRLIPFSKFSKKISE